MGPYVGICLELFTFSVEYSYLSSSQGISFMERSTDLIDLNDFMLLQQDYSLLFIHLLVTSIIVDMWSSLSPLPSHRPRNPTFFFTTCSYASFTYNPAFINPFSSFIQAAINLQEDTPSLSSFSFWLGIESSLYLLFFFYGFLLIFLSNSSLSLMKNGF